MALAYYMHSALTPLLVCLSGYPFVGLRLNLVDICIRDTQAHNEWDASAGVLAGLSQLSTQTFSLSASSAPQPLNRDVRVRSDPVLDPDPLNSKIGGIETTEEYFLKFPYPPFPVNSLPFLLPRCTVDWVEWRIKYTRCIHSFLSALYDPWQRVHHSLLIFQEIWLTPIFLLFQHVARPSQQKLSSCFGLKYSHVLFKVDSKHARFTFSLIFMLYIFRSRQCTHVTLWNILVRYITCTLRQ